MSLSLCYGIIISLHTLVSHPEKPCCSQQHERTVCEREREGREGGERENIGDTIMLHVTQNEKQGNRENANSGQLTRKRNTCVLKSGIEDSKLSIIRNHKLHVIILWFSSNFCVFYESRTHEIFYKVYCSRGNDGD